MAIEQHQLELIEQQLGRKPRGLVNIAATSARGVPLVLQMRSLVDDQPFPTLYWLCSRDLCKAIGQIETTGWIKTIEARLEEDSKLRESYRQDHRRYVSQRWQCMNPGDRLRIEELGLSALFDRYGIGGITQWDKVRCLHMHYAHYLIDDNCIGALLDQQFKLSELLISR